MKIEYRREIDGLRAIAVVAVILYHAQINIFGHQTFKGGFIGVDIFFVISGYLITSIILKELVATNSFSFKNFYERRIRRILPALLLVILVSLPFAWFYLLPNSLVDFCKSILYSLGFSSNFYFWDFGLQYGAERGLLLPFLHTWSLSVEEQFYIIFPIILFTIFKYFKKFLIHIFMIGFFVSLALADWGSINYPSFNFYILPTRAWELLAGSVMAYFEITKGHRSKSQRLNFVLPTIGLCMILHSIFFFNDKMFHPSVYTLFPIIGVCLIIWFSNKDEIITKILSTKFFVGTGLISYSLYLWHYPIFAFSKLTDFMNKSLINLLLLLIIIVTLSILTYYFVERPTRNKKNNSIVIIGTILISIFSLIIFNFYIIQNKGFIHRMPKIILSSLPNTKDINSKDCYRGKTCKFNSSSNKKVFLIGDSHAGRLLSDLKTKIINRNYQFVTNVYGACFYWRKFNRVILKNQKITECNDKYFKKIEYQISRNKNSILIFSGYYRKYLSETFKQYIPVGEYKTLEDSLKNEILKFSKKNKIILVYPIPEFAKNPNQLILNQWVKQRFPKNFKVRSITVSDESYKNRTKSIFELLDSIKHNNIYRIYPHTLFCDKNIKNKCVAHDSKNLFYEDTNHPSSKGAEMINDLIMRQIEKIELKQN